MKRQISIVAASILAVAATASIAGTPGKKASDSAVTTTPTAVRDWSKVDTNRDNLVSPEEMEKFLASAWAARKAASK